ncbi:MAG: hypothetical protein J0H34_23805 [Rhizobiales bacterium]|jgi:hypothetical protein|nr:hypothetical protein [Hyphomicrobiales bacterium]
MSATLADTRSAYRAASATAAYEADRLLTLLARYGGLPESGAAVMDVVRRRCHAYATAIAERDEAAQRLTEYESEQQEESACPSP